MHLLAIILMRVVKGLKIEDANDFFLPLLPLRRAALSLAWGQTTSHDQCRDMFGPWRVRSIKNAIVLWKPSNRLIFSISDSGQSPILLWQHHDSIAHCARSGGEKRSSKRIRIGLITQDELHQTSVNNITVAHPVRGTICGHTVVTNTHYVQQTTLKLCGCCTHSWGGGCMYSPACDITTPSPPPPIHPPKAVPQSCSVYQMGTKVRGEFHTFLGPPLRKKAIGRGRGEGGSNIRLPSSSWSIV